MSKSEKNANREILNPPANADVGEIGGAAQDEKREAEIDELRVFSSTSMKSSR